MENETRLNMAHIKQALPKERKVSEYEIHTKFVAWIRKEHPAVKFIHPENEGRRNFRKATSSRNMGMKAGQLDLYFLHSVNGFNGLAIELKVKPNRPSPDQNQEILELKEMNWVAEVVYSLDEAKEKFRKYFQLT